METYGVRNISSVLHTGQSAHHVAVEVMF